MWQNGGIVGEMVHYVEEFPSSEMPKSHLIELYGPNPNMNWMHHVCLICKSYEIYCNFYRNTKSF